MTISIPVAPRLIAALFSLIACFDSHAGGNKISLSIGAYFSQGAYGMEDPISLEALPKTKVSAIPLSLKLRSERWMFGLHSAHVNVHSNQTELYLDDEFDLQSETHKVSHSGLSDLSIKVSYKLPKLVGRSQFRLGTKIKLPTSDSSKNLSSGETDYSLFINNSTRFNKYIWGNQLGYQLMGDTPTRNYHNRWFARISGQRLLSRHWLGGLSYYFKQASSNTTSPIRKLNASVSWIPKKTLNYTLFTGFGFSDSSPDWSGGFQVTNHF